MCVWKEQLFRPLADQRRFHLISCSHCFDAMPLTSSQKKRTTRGVRHHGDSSAAIDESIPCIASALLEGICALAGGGALAPDAPSMFGSGGGGVAGVLMPAAVNSTIVLPPVCGGAPLLLLCRPAGGTVCQI